MSRIRKSKKNLGEGVALFLFHIVSQQPGVGGCVAIVKYLEIENGKKRYAMSIRYLVGIHNEDKVAVQGLPNHIHNT